jgi:hypothetical protein
VALGFVKGIARSSMVLLLLVNSEKLGGGKMDPAVSPSMKFENMLVHGGSCLLLGSLQGHGRRLPVHHRNRLRAVQVAVTSQASDQHYDVQRPRRLFGAWDLEKCLRSDVEIVHPTNLVLDRLGDVPAIEAGCSQASVTKFRSTRRAECICTVDFAERFARFLLHPCESLCIRRSG